MKNDKFRRALYVGLFILCLTPIISAPFALITGFLFTTIFGQPFQKNYHKTASTLLKLSVIGLGFGISTEKAFESSSNGFWLTVSSIVIVMILGLILGKIFKTPTKLTYLINSGTAICGGSAIAAISPAIDASEKDTSIALGVVFFLNSVALLIFPLIGEYFDMSQSEFGLWCAVAIHDTSSVVGASSAYGGEALEVATTVKLARALWIIPLSLLSAVIFKNRGKKIAFPYFILFFVLAMLANSYMPSLSSAFDGIYSVAKHTLVATLFLIGSSLSVKIIKNVGFKPLLVAIILWFVISVFAFLWIMKIF